MSPREDKQFVDSNKSGTQWAMGMCRPKELQMAISKVFITKVLLTCQAVKFSFALLSVM